MDDFIYNIISVILIFFAIGWTIFTIFINWGTTCFNVLYTYITLTALIFELVWDNFIKKWISY